MSNTSGTEPRVIDGDRHFRTDDVEAQLRRRSVRGTAITFLGRGGQFAVTIGFTAVLARLLTPEDFGLVAMVTVVTVLVMQFKDLGLLESTVQRSAIDQAQISTLFWINVLVSAALSGVMPRSSLALSRSVRCSRRIPTVDRSPARAAAWMSRATGASAARASPRSKATACGAARVPTISTPTTGRAAVIRTAPIATAAKRPIGLRRARSISAF